MYNKLIEESFNNFYKALKEKCVIYGRCRGICACCEVAKELALEEYKRVEKIINE